MPAHYPLLQRFYRAQRSGMRVRDASQVWVARDAELRAGLCLRRVEHGHWITGLLVDAALRRRGIAGHLLARVRQAMPGPLWLFCDPALADFYRRQGFAECQQLPAALDSRLARYRRSQRLLALCSTATPPC